MTTGAFSEASRAAIYEVNGGRCVGCGRTGLTAQHRLARGRGGTSNPLIGSPANGVPLCGSGVTGCHGWTEAHPIEAELLGWRLPTGTPALGAPFWTRFGWYAWGEDDGFYFVVWVDEDDLDRAADRAAAVRYYKTMRKP